MCVYVYAMPAKVHVHYMQQCLSTHLIIVSFCSTILYYLPTIPLLSFHLPCCSLHTLVYLLTLVWTMCTLLALILFTKSYMSMSSSIFSLSSMASKAMKVPVLPTPALQWTSRGGPDGKWSLRMLLINARMLCLLCGTPYWGQPQ